MIDFAGFDARARVIADRLHCSADAVPEHFHAIITDFCNRWFPIRADGTFPNERALCYEMLWRFVLERCEQRLDLLEALHQRS